MDITIPSDVPPALHEQYYKNYGAATDNTNRLMLFAYDQKIEHLNDDFCGPQIHPDALKPEHPFKIAHYGRIGAIAAPLGLIARYGKYALNAHYLVKLTGKTNLVVSSESDPLSTLLWSINDIMRFKKNSGLNIIGIGLTIYLGSSYESVMLATAAQLINHAHEHGLLTLLWIYIRGKAIEQTNYSKFMPGATGLANALGSDFVKIKPPIINGSHAAHTLISVTEAAGNTGVLCAGELLQPPMNLFTNIHDELHIGKTHGAAIGRNIFQRSFPEAVAITHGLSALIYDDVSPDKAYEIYEESLK